MRILIPLVGSRGDVQPGVVLGVELQRRGQTVVVGAPPNFVDFMGSAGLKARQFGSDVHALYSSPEGQRALATGPAGRSRHPSGVELGRDGLRRVGTQR